MRYVFRADAAQDIGSGHVMRSTAIAEEFIARGEDVIFIGSTSGVPWLDGYLSNIGFSKIYPESMSFTSNPMLDVLILDSYTLQTDDAFIQPEKWHRIVLVADETTPSYKSDLVFYPGLLSNVKVRNDTKVFAGPKYIPFRSSIQKSKKKLQASEVIEILVVGGGTDPFNFVKEISKILTSLNENFHANVFSGDKHLIKSDSRITVFPIGPSLDECAGNADLVFTTASTMSLEFIAREKAVGIGCAVDNQKSYYNSLSSFGLAAPIGQYEASRWHINSDLVYELTTSADLRNSFVEKSSGLIDLQGVSRIVDIIYSVNSL